MRKGKKAEQGMEQTQPEAVIEAAPVQQPGVVEPPVRKVAIVGCSDTKMLAPFDDPTWEIWGMNNAFGHIKRRSAWFEIHPLKKDQAGHFWRRKLIKPGVFEWSRDFRGQDCDAYVAELAKLGCPIYMQAQWDEIPGSLPYPIADIIKKFGRYFTNSVSYMIALAIDLGYTDIGCYGVDMATASEYGPQRPSCEFFLGLAAGFGRRLIIPEQSDLLKTRFLYGFEERLQVAWEKKIHSMLDAMQQRYAKADAQRASSNKQCEQYIGAMEAVKEVERIWSNLADQKIWRDE